MSATGPNPARRALPGGAAALALPRDRAEGQAAGMLRIGRALAAIPLAIGCPGRGGEGPRAMATTLRDAQVARDRSRADRPAALKPGLAPTSMA